MKDYSYRANIKAPELAPKDFVIANNEDVQKLQEEVKELKTRIEGLYDIIEELAKKI